MPLTPAQRALYPPDWAAVSARIRARAGDRCECDGRCGLHSGLCGAVNRESHPVTGSRVVLTVAHLDHALTDHDDPNLAAMCQRCHLAFDAAHRRLLRPIHLVRAAGDKHSVCGRRDPLPVLIVRATSRHAAGHGAVFCAICVVGLGPLAPKVPTAQPEQETPQ